MHPVYAHVDGALGAGEVMKSEAALGRKVPNGGSARISVGNQQIGGKFVGGVDEPSGTLEPGLESGANG